MRERLTHIAMTAFRGVPTLWEVDFEDGRSLVVYGDNATGKSTIADAVEFYFTGRIGLLQHEGREHAIRHVGAHASVPTSVAVTTTGDLGGEAVPGVERALPGAHETCLLRGRTLAEFVDKTKGEKWRSLSELLGLESIDRLRLDLQRVRNDLRADVAVASADVERASREVAQRVGETTEDSLLSAIRNACSSSGVEPPATLAQAMQPEWAESLALADASASNAAPIAGLVARANGLGPVQIDPALITAWNDVVGTSNASSRVRAKFFEAASEMLEITPEPATCPLCGQKADHDELVASVRAVLDEIRAESDRLQEAKSALDGVIALVASELNARRRLLADASTASVVLDQVPGEIESYLMAAQRAHELISQEELDERCHGLEAWDKKVAASFSEIAPTGLDPRSAALVDIAVLTERGRAWTEGMQRVQDAGAAKDLAEKILLAYQTRERQYLAGILDRISDRVAALYERLHPGEGLTAVSIEPWSAKGIELAVTFHGSRQRPPHGVLSESHLNSLAVALFLAMAETFNDRLGFVVLDDVINSFDIGHRGALAELLVSEFPESQVIVLTHDQLFFQHLSRRAPSWGKLELTSWSFEEGPRTTGYDAGSMLEMAAERLLAGDANGAATKTRRALEELLQEIGEGLEAPVPFRRGVKNDRREIGEMFAGLRRALRDSARDFYGEIEPLITALEADTQAALNPEAHASQQWTSDQEVRAALTRVTQLEAAMSCAACSTRIWSVGSRQAGRCRCGARRYPPASGADNTADAQP